MEQDKPKTEEDKTWEKALSESKEPERPLTEQLTFLKDSITRYETLAFESEEAKLHGTLLLIEEIEQSMSNYSSSALSNIKSLRQAAVAAQYSKSSLSDPNVMDNYDAKVLELITALQEFKENTSEFENHARAKLIYDDIMKADKQDFLLRTRYNINVSDFNKLLREKEDEIDELDYQYRKLKEYPFYWGEDPQGSNS